MRALGRIGYSLAVPQRRLFLIVLLALLTSAPWVLADDAGAVAEPPPKAKLIVGTVETAPFIVKQDGEWTGISMELWKRVAREIGVEYEVREYTRQNWRERAPKETDVFVSMNITEKAS